MNAPSTASSGECRYQKQRFEFRVLNLEFVRGKSLLIEAVCYNPSLEYPHNKEKTLTYATNNFFVEHEELKIAMAIINAIVKKSKLPKNRLYKLCVKDSKIFFILG
jgi:hypothetical protein